MAIIFDSKQINVMNGNSVNLADLTGSGKLIGFSIGVQNGNYSDPFDGSIIINYDSKSITLNSNYFNINNIVREELKFNKYLNITLYPNDTKTVNFFILYDDYSLTKSYNNRVTIYTNINISSNNTMNIPIASGARINLRGITLSCKSTELFMNIDTGEYLFQNKSTASLPDGLDSLYIPGDRLYVTLENKSATSIQGVMVIDYEFD